MSSIANSLEDFAGEVLQVSFYEQKLQIGKPPPYYVVESILRN